MGMKQQMKQTLGMTMTPQLQQAIKILQMSVMELQTEVSNALVENPTLEEDNERGEEDNSISNMGAAGEGEDRNQEPGQSSIDKDRITDAKDDFDWENYLEQSSGNREYLPSTKNFNPDDLPNFEQVLSKTTTLYEHLLWQLRLTIQDPKEFEIGENIIGNLNDDGYLMVFTQELAHSLDVSIPDVESVLKRVQKMDPPGVAARDLKECLMIQARQMDYYDDVAELIEKCLSELETKNYEQIAKKLNLALDEVIELSKIIHGMEPKPGRIFAHQDSHFIVPDIYIVKTNDGMKYNIVLNEEGIPRLKISRIYQEQLSAGALKGETRSYIREKLKNAIALMRSIYQRQRTIYRVTEAILKRQMNFFEKGLSQLKPMVLKDIAEELGLHESTISRVTTNKYVHTPQGIFELKYFFNSAITKSDGTDDVASESVRQKIKEFVAVENPKKPLSDQQLTKMLEEHNINIARRTVAKYREALGILPSSKRKKYF
jgi:RNA polymerase sigma-54 factor